MTTTITTATGPLVPDLVLGYEAARAGRNVFHDIIGRADPDVSLQPAAPRAGTLQLFFLTEPQAVVAAAAHAVPAVFTLADSTYPTIGMRYVLDGRIGIKLDHTRWIVSVDFREVLS